MSALTEENLDVHDAEALRLPRSASQQGNQLVRWSLEGDRRSSIRLCVEKPVILELASRNRQAVTFQNLSLGGVGLTDAPERWERDSPVAFTLLHKGERLWVNGRVNWRQRQNVGVAFARRTPDQDRQVYRFLRTLLQEAPAN